METISSYFIFGFNYGFVMDSIASNIFLMFIWFTKPKCISFQPMKSDTEILSTEEFTKFDDFIFDFEIAFNSRNKYLLNGKL